MLNELILRALPGEEALLERMSAQWGALSTWLAEGLPAQADVDAWVSELAEPAKRVPLWEAVTFCLPDAQQVEAWLREVAAQAAPFWLWDPASLSDAQRNQIGKVGVLAAHADALSGLEGIRHGLRTVQLTGAEGLGVISLAWGIPWNGLELSAEAGGLEDGEPPLVETEPAG